MRRLPGVSIHWPTPRASDMVAVEKIEPSNVSFESFVQTLKKRGLSERMRNLLIRTHVGKRVTWTGYVRQVRLGVGMTEQSHLIVLAPIPERSWDVALCWMREDGDWEIDSLPAGERLTVTGILQLDATGGPVLDDCRIVQTATAPAVSPQ